MGVGLGDAYSDRGWIREASEDRVVVKDAVGDDCRQLHFEWEQGSVQVENGSRL